jgi:hypothetical protein
MKIRKAQVAYFNKPCFFESFFEEANFGGFVLNTIGSSPFGRFF